MRKEVDKASPVPRYHQLEIILEEGIKSNVYPVGSELPPERILCREYRLARATVRQALDALERKGLVLREQGKGTQVVSARGIEQVNGDNLVALIVPSRGHVYEKFSRQMIRLIQEQDCHAVVADIELMDQRTQRPRVIRLLERLLKFNPRSIVVDGLSYFPFDWLKRRQFDRIVFTLNYESPEPLANAHYVLIDYEQGGALGIKHLIEQGHRDIVLWTFPPQAEPHFFISDFIQGCRKGYEEKGLDWRRHFSVVADTPSAEKNKAILRQLMTRKNPPTAFFALADSRATAIYEVAKELGLAIPRDLSVIGFYNTPWCEMFDPKLTSISINEDEIAGLTVDHIFNSRGGKDRIRVKPSLVVRGSSVR